MGLDASYFFKNNFEIYFGFFMDELTPEWIFKKKIITGLHGNLDFSKRNFIINRSYLLFEYNGQIREFTNTNIHLTISIVMKLH